MSRSLIFVARFLMAFIFVVTGIGKISNFSETESMLAAQGIPLAAAVTVIVTVIELGGGLMLLFSPWPGWAALVLCFYLIPVTLTMHNFWAAPPEQHQMQEIQFLKNLAIMGGLLAFYTRESK
jgi:putative oxidoreductase